MKKYIIVTFLLSILMTNCISQLEESAEPSSYCPKVNVSLKFQDSPVTKSEIEGMLSSDKLQNLNIFLYDANGMLFDKRYYDDIQNTIVEFELYNNAEYSLYAIGNVGIFPVSYKEEQLESYIYRIKAASDIVQTGSIPMAAHTKLKTGDTTSFSINMERIASVIDLRLNCPDGLDIKISEIAVKSMPDAMALFDDTPHKRNILPGDKLDIEECKKLQNGETISLYSLEYLESPNEILSNSVIENIEDIPENCPYIHIKGHITNSVGLTTADIDYRIALNYKIRRNKRYLLTIDLTSKGVFEDSYKINVTNAAFDFAITRLRVPVGQKKLLYCPISKYAPLEYSTFAHWIARVDTKGYVEGMAEGITVITARCPSLGIEQVCEVEVTPADSLEPNIEDFLIMAGQKYNMHFYAPLGGYIKFMVTDPLNPDVSDSLILDIVHDRGIINLENRMVKITYDPMTVGTEQDEFVTFVSKDEVMVDYELIMPDGQYAYSHNEIYSAFMNYNANKFSIKENERLDFELYLSNHYERLTRDDFASIEIYNKLYNRFDVSIPHEFRDIIRIESFDPETGKGTVVPISAKGNKKGINVRIDAFVTGSKKNSSATSIFFKVFPS